MGMTNEQFDSYKVQILRRLEHVAEETKAVKSKALDLLIADLKAELNKA